MGLGASSEDPGGGLSGSVLGREEGSFFDVVRGFRTDAHGGKDGCVQVFDGNRVLDRHQGTLVRGLSVHESFFDSSAEHGHASCPR